MAGPCRQLALVAKRHYRPRTRNGPKPSLTPLQEIELIAWYKARCALGTWKTKAVELGVPETTLKNAVERRLGLR